MGTRFKKARFHVLTGPKSLFDRVHFKMKGKRHLYINSQHFQERAQDHDAPIDIIKYFDSNEWELMTVEIRTDTGKFVNSSWTRSIDGTRWWIVIGFNDTVETVIKTDKMGLGSSIVKNGETYEYVDRVNRELMMAEILDPSE